MLLKHHTSLNSKNDYIRPEFIINIFISFNLQQRNKKKFNQKFKEILILVEYTVHADLFT